MSQSQRFDSRGEEPFLRPSAAGPVVTLDPRAATLVLMVGLPAAGKTTRAKELAATHQALRLTPDHWMVPLFGDPMADSKRWVLEGRLISVALQTLRLGTSVVLDYGLWGRRVAGLARVGSSTTGPHAPTANPAVQTAFVLASGAAGVLTAGAAPRSGRLRSPPLHQRDRLRECRLQQAPVTGIQGPRVLIVRQPPQVRGQHRIDGPDSLAGPPDRRLFGLVG